MINFSNFTFGKNSTYQNGANHLVSGDKIGKMKFFEILFKIVVIILVLLSTMALLLIHIQAFKESVILDMTGLNNYLEFYSGYSALFGAAIATLSLLFGLLRLNEATITNVEKLKQDRFNEWKLYLEVRVAEVEKNNSIMKREFIRERWLFFGVVYRLKFRIANKNQLIDAFEGFKKLVATFESNHSRTQNLGEIYPNRTTSYSFNDFSYVFFGGIYDFYPEMFDDLSTLYIQNLSTSRIIDKAAYDIAAKKL